MAGVRHKFVSAVGDGADETLVRPSNWNADHDIIEYEDVTGGASVPAAPAAGKARRYVKISGTTPNRNIRIGWLLEDGTDIVLADVTI